MQLHRSPPPHAFCDSRTHKSVFECFFLLFTPGFNVILTHWGVNGGAVVTFPGSCMLHNFWHVTETIKPPYSCARINKSHSTSLCSPTILYSVFIESCSNRCQASALLPFSHEDVGILGRPSLSADRRDGGRVGGRGGILDQWVNPPLNMFIIKWQSSRWVSGRMVTDRIAHHNANQGCCIVAGTNLEVWPWRVNLDKLHAAESD
jgi:hypothetical protein